MQSHIFPTMYMLIIFIAITFVFAPFSVFAKDDERYLNCTNLFDCGYVKGIGYPFWGSNRPDYCGYPGFELNCSGQYPLITVMKLTYEVYGIINKSRYLKVARKDYMENICPRFLVNTTLNPNLNYAADVQNITLYYGCPEILIPNPSSSRFFNQFSCNINNTDMVGYYVTTNQSGLDNINANLSSYLGLCSTSVIIPAFQSTALRIGSNTTEANLIEVFNQGFGLEWNANDTFCDACKFSGGQCGFNQTADAFTCYCKDQPQESICAASPTNQSRAGLLKRHLKRHWRLVITIGISITVVLILAVYIILMRFTEREGLFSGKKMSLWWKNTKHNQKIEAFMENYHSLIPKRYSYSDIKNMTNSFNNKLGQGGFGGVYKGRLLDGRFVAVKVLTKLETDGEEFINEVASISRTSHINIVSLLGFCYEKTKRALIYEYMPNGSLDKYIFHKGSPPINHRLEWEMLYEIAVGIARGLEYLHKGCNIRIVHFDIKPHNILLDEDFCPKISDFGLAKLCKSKESKVSMTVARGTVGYIAPEVFCRNFGGVSYKSDVYSYGMMALEMVGERRNSDTVLSQTSEMYFPDWFYKHLEQGKISRLEEGISSSEEEIVRKMILVGLWCIQTNPSDRPSMTKVVEMFEGSLQSLEIPPKPFQSSSIRFFQEQSSPTLSLPEAWSQRDEEKKVTR